MHFSGQNERSDEDEFEDLPPPEELGGSGPDRFVVLFLFGVSIAVLIGLLILAY